MQETNEPVAVSLDIDFSKQQLRRSFIFLCSVERTYNKDHMLAFVNNRTIVLKQNHYQDYVIAKKLYHRKYNKGSIFYRQIKSLGEKLNLCPHCFKKNINSIMALTEHIKQNARHICLNILGKNNVKMFKSMERYLTKKDMNSLLLTAIARNKIKIAHHLLNTKNKFDLVTLINVIYWQCYWVVHKKSTSQTLFIKTLKRIGTYERITKYDCECTRFGVDILDGIDICDKKHPVVRHMIVGAFRERLL
jgi:hypothetical protein